MNRSAVVLVGIFVACTVATPLFAQEHRTLVFGEIGGASLGHADSEQGNAPIWGGGAAFFLTPNIAIEGDVHTGRVSHVFGREHHNFSQTTITGSLLFIVPAGASVRFLAGGGLGTQRAHTVFNEPPFRPVDDVETIRLLHGRVGAEFSASKRIVIRTDAALWMGDGLDWVFGGRVGVGYRF